MSDESPYSKREQDEWRNEIRSALERIEESLIADDRTVAELTRITSHNSGQIKALWDSWERNQKATKLIEDISSFWKVGRWFVLFVIGAGALYAALKTLATAQLSKLLDFFK